MNSNLMNLEAEQSVLGSMMVDRAAVETALALIEPSDFYRPTHTIIFQAIRALHRRSVAVDILTVQEELRRKNLLDEVGGTEYLAATHDALPTSANCEYYAKIVREKAIIRSVIGYARKLQALAEGQVESASDLLGQALEGILAIRQPQAAGEFHPYSEILQTTWHQLEAAREAGTGITGIPTGIEALDEMTLGWFPGDLTVIAGRPGQGKTLFALQLAEHAAAQGYPTAIWSLEMKDVQLALRSIQALSNLSGYQLRKPQHFDTDQWVQVASAVGPLHDLPLYINDSATLSYAQIPLQARRAVAQWQIKLLILDFAQLVYGPKGETRNREVGIVAQVMKETAKSLNVPFIALSQLSRRCEQEHRAPGLSDLRDSGEIEQHVDVAIFIHHPGDDKPSQLIVAKNRQLGTGIVKVAWLKQRMRFVPASEREETNGQD